jgi:hypothetical protein
MSTFSKQLEKMEKEQEFKKKVRKVECSPGKVSSVQSALGGGTLALYSDEEEDLCPSPVTPPPSRVPEPVAAVPEVVEDPPCEQAPARFRFQTIGQLQRRMLYQCNGRFNRLFLQNLRELMHGHTL